MQVKETLRHRLIIFFLTVQKTLPYPFLESKQSQLLSFIETFTDDLANHGFVTTFGQISASQC